MDIFDIMLGIARNRVVETRLLIFLESPPAFITSPSFTVWKRRTQILRFHTANDGGDGDVAAAAVMGAATATYG